MQVEELEVMRSQAKEIVKKSEIEQRKKNKLISTLKDEVNNLRRNDQLLTVMKEKLETKNKGHVALQEANKNLKKKIATGASCELPLVLTIPIYSPMPMKALRVGTKNCQRQLP